jgi:hypothetical protein
MRTRSHVALCSPKDVGIFSTSDENQESTLGCVSISDSQQLDMGPIETVTSNSSHNIGHIILMISFKAKRNSKRPVRHPQVREDFRC